MRTKPIVSAATFATLLGTLAWQDAQAASVFTYDPLATSAETRPNGLGQNGGPYTIGSRFTVNVSGLTITHLGVMDVDNAQSGYADGDGFVAASIPVAIWNATTGNSLLISTTVSTNATYIDGYRYVQLATPIALDSGSSYVIAAVAGSGYEYFLDRFNNTTKYTTSSSDFTFTANTYNNGGTLTLPTSAGTQIGRWAVANALVSPVSVPEPSAALLGALGVLGLLRRRRN